MSGDFGIVYPLWTDPQGAGDLLDRAVGEVGLDHVTVPVITGRIELFRLNPAQPPHLFFTEGGWHFPPNHATYKSSSIRPRPARWFGKRDVLARVCDHAAGRGIRVLMRIAPRGIAGMLEHEPHLRARNAWGDEVIAAGACPQNAYLRELVNGALEDVQRYGPAGFQLVDWVPDAPPDHEGPRPLDWHPPAKRLGDVCFCSACRQIATTAGIDPDEVARRVREAVKRLLAEPVNDHGVRETLDEPLLESYDRVRRQDTAAWLGRLARAYSHLRSYLLYAPACHEAAAEFVSQEAFTLVLSNARRDGALDEAELLAASRAATTPCGITLPVWKPAIDQSDRLVRLVSNLTAGGTTFIDFEGLDEAPYEAVTWLKQAVRFARRG